jgi:hypothetical protein
MRVRPAVADTPPVVEVAIPAVEVAIRRVAVIRPAAITKAEVLQVTSTNKLM